MGRKSGASSAGKSGGGKGRCNSTNPRTTGANPTAKSRGSDQIQNPSASCSADGYKGKEKISDDASFSGGRDKEHSRNFGADFTNFTAYVKPHPSDFEASFSNGRGQGNRFTGSGGFVIGGRFGQLMSHASSSDGPDPSERDIMYKILGVDRSASQKYIKRAYRKMALRLHPDKNRGDQEAKNRFQLLQKIMSILGDVEKRDIYDRTGCFGVSPFVGESRREFMELCKSVLKKVTEEDNDEFITGYKGSEFEKKDLKALYDMCEGDMDRLLPLMFFAESNQDSQRFKDIIDHEISTGSLKMTEHYEKWAAQISVEKAPNDPYAKNRKKPEEYVGEQFRGRTFVKIIDVMHDKYSKQYLGFLSASHSKSSLGLVECYARVYESKSLAEEYYKLMRRCSHENILHATDYAENEELAVITFEPIEETLESYINRKGETLCTARKPGYIVEFTEDLRNKTKCIIGGLAYLHGMGIWHGDLQLNEIFVTKSGVIKLALVEREFNKQGRYSMQGDVKSLGSMYELIVGIVNIADGECPYWRDHMNNFCWETKDGRYKSAIDLLSHTLLYSPLQKESLLINSHGTRNLKSEQAGVGSRFDRWKNPKPWRAHFKNAIATLDSKYDTYDDDLYPGYRRFCRNSLTHMNESESSQLKGILRSKELALRAFEAYYPPLLYELSNLLHKKKKLKEYVHL